ncbi:MAG: hypothetical protein QM504_06915 [Pseudomonadota bacterium]
MPENFSKDMPAHNMIEKVNIDDSAVYVNSDKSTLIRRYWDVQRKNGWTEKNIGSLMLSIYIKKASKEYNVLDRFQLVQAIDAQLHELYDAHNIEAKNSGNTIHQVHLPFIEYNYQDYITNNQKWISTGTETHHEMSHLYVIPISDNKFIEVEFSFMPNDDYNLRKFVVDVAGNEVNRIMSTFSFRYVSGNKAVSVVEDMTQPDLKYLIESNIKAPESID